MSDMTPVLLGTAGFVTGEFHPLRDGMDLVIGRSRSCDISLRRSRGYLTAKPEERDEDHDFNTVSRRHVRLQVRDGVIHLQDMSSNGTFCNDQPVQQEHQVDPANGTATLRLGTREAYQITLLPAEDPRLAEAAAVDADPANA